MCHDVSARQCAQIGISVTRGGIEKLGNVELHQIDIIGEQPQESWVPVEECNDGGGGPRPENEELGRAFSISHMVVC